MSTLLLLRSTVGGPPPDVFSGGNSRMGAAALANEPGRMGPAALGSVARRIGVSANANAGAARIGGALLRET